MSIAAHAGVIIWGMLVAGAALTGIGLLRSTARFLEKRRIQEGFDGEIVLGDRLLQCGQSAKIALGTDALLFPENRASASADAEDADRLLDAEIVSVSRSVVVLAVAAAPSNRTRGDGFLFAPLGAEIVVTVYGATAIYRFRGKVRDLRKEPSPSDQFVLTLSRPTWLARVQRRRHVRTDIQLPATFELLRGLSATCKQRAAAAIGLPLHGTVLDLSGGGLRAEVARGVGAAEAASLEASLLPGALLRVRLPLPALADTPLVARVCSGERIASRGGLALRVCCEFLHTSPWVQDLIVQQVFRSQRELLAKRAKPLGGRLLDKRRIP